MNCPIQRHRFSQCGDIKLIPRLYLGQRHRHRQRSEKIIFYCYWFDRNTSQTDGSQNRWYFTVTGFTGRHKQTVVRTDVIGQVLVLPDNFTNRQWSEKIISYCYCDIIGHRLWKWSEQIIFYWYWFYRTATQTDSGRSRWYFTVTPVLSDLVTNRRWPEQMIFYSGNTEHSHKQTVVRTDGILLLLWKYRIWSQTNSGQNRWYLTVTLEIPDMVTNRQWSEQIIFYCYSGIIGFSHKQTRVGTDDILLLLW